MQSSFEEGDKGPGRGGGGGGGGGEHYRYKSPNVRNCRTMLDFL